jgi:pimeloyl-ACP methyl ester carboxylesterase
MSDNSLPLGVVAALDAPPPGERITVEAGGIPWSALTWGDPTNTPILILHGVTSSARDWWRVGPALAAVGHRVVALDQTGHGHTGHWQGHHAPRDNARDVATFIRAAGLDRSDLVVIGHSWGAVTTAALPIAGIFPAVLVLEDPPVVTHARISLMAAEAEAMIGVDEDTILSRLREENPEYADGDILAKADALARIDIGAATSIVLDNGDWDGGLADLRDPAASGMPVRFGRGDPACGGLTPDEALAAFDATIGHGHIQTIHEGTHSMHRTRPVETVAALLHAIDLEGD